MKKIIAIFLLVSATGALFAQAQPAGGEPRDSQPIVVGGDQSGPQSTSTVRTVTTKKGYAATTTVPETVTTVTAPDKVLVREALLTWLSVGLRSSIDYHLTPSTASMSCLWLYGELYNTAWGVQAGIGYMWVPLKTYTDAQGNVYNGIGSRDYFNLDLIGKYYWWFARSWWVGAGMNYAALLGGQLKYYDNTTTATAAANQATNNAAIANWADIYSGGGILYAQVGTGLKMAMGTGFNVVNFEPEFRALIPLTTPLNNSSAYGVVLRFNIGFSYAFGL